LIKALACPPGSFATDLGCPQDVRFSPESDRIADVPDWQLPGFVVTVIRIVDRFAF
jgi:hypothetical protein